jgi:non-ribosomal peptide synthase protein (TIGR01720 family)
VTPGALQKWMADEDITIGFVPTPMAELLLELEWPADTALRIMLTGGDVLHRRPAPGTPFTLVNNYGVTEATVVSTSGVVAPEGAGLPSIGRSIAGTTLRVLGADGRVVPDGEPGELFISGRSVATGYLNRPELTAERFVPDPFGTRAGTRLYRTGDRMRWSENAQLEFLGRQDDQVKLRGNRIELGEIEAVLSKYAGVRQCAVTVMEVAGRQMLLAYVTGEAEAVELKEHAARELPTYMVPQRIVKLDALPLTANGKVDRKALPGPEGVEAAAAGGYCAPRTPVEEVLCRVWGEVLGRERVGIHDNFFELGGDSILSIQIGVRASQCGLRLTTRDLFEHQTVAALSAGVAGLERAAAGVGVGLGLSEGEAVPLTPIQRWFFAQGWRREWHYNQAALLADAGGADGGRMQAAVERVLAAHEVFELRYERVAGEVRQHYAGRASEREEAQPRRCGRADLRALPRAVQGRVIEQLAAQAQAGLDLEAGRLVAALRCEVTGGGRLLVVAHHLVIDGVSWRILLDQVERAYADSLAGGESSWRAQGSSFGQWAQALVQEAASDETGRELEYWVRQQPGSDERLPRDFYESGANTVGSGARVAVEFDQAQTEVLLREVPRRLRAQVDEVLLLGVVEALREWGGKGAAVVECEGHGRQPLPGLDVSQTVGWFTTLYPVRFQSEAESGATNQGGRTITERLREVRERLRAVPRKGLGYGLLKYIGQAEELAGAGAEVSFNYLGQWDANLGGLFRAGGESPGASQWAGEQRPHLVEVHGSVHGGRLSMVWTFSRNLHRKQTMERLLALFRRTVEAVIAACGDKRNAPVAADFPLAKLDDKRLKGVLARLEQRRQRAN